jgi:hypothetical protein
MKRFYAQLNDDSFTSVPATAMLKDDNMLYVYNGDELVAVMDVTVVLYARISEEKGKNT